MKMNKKIESSNKTIFYEGQEATVSLKVDLPEKLYKYYALTERTLKNLVDQKIHFSHPYSLNDIMDGSFMLWDTTDFYNDYLISAENPANKEDFADAFYHSQTEQYYKHRGVLSLTDSFDNKLFWPHYTSEQGFCIEFETNNFLERFKTEGEVIIFPISYEPLRRRNFNEHIIKSDFNSEKNINANLPILYALSFKDEIWSYEKEWRILLKKDFLGEVSHPLNHISDLQYDNEIKNLINRNIPYNYDSINKIILSILFFHKDRFNLGYSEPSLTNTDSVNCTRIIYYFRKMNTVDNKLLIDFLTEIKNKFGQKIFQLDKVFDESTNIFVNKLKYRIVIIDIDFDRVVIEKIEIIETNE